VDYAQFDVSGDLAVSADELAIVVVLSRLRLHDE
jgi:hypothetical protein